MRPRSLLLVLALSLAAPALAKGADRSSHSFSSSSHSRYAGSDQNSSQNRNSDTRTDLNDWRDVLRRLPVIPVAQAADIAQQRVPGTLLHAEIETNDGIRTWQLDIQPRTGHSVRLWLNANTGAFLRMVER
ncbi:MAG TPA: PepSY domain-containing protein [Rhizomicrobium sp.]|nr:PepSY domain-containing protein [Rhizomicrobium sp.]